MDRERIFVVLPAYNEQAVIEGVVREVAGRYPNVVVVDDGSSDDTATAARRGGAVVLRHVLNRGQYLGVVTWLGNDGHARLVLRGAPDHQWR